MNLKNQFNDVYSKFKIHFYHEMFGKIKMREATLTTMETFCMEIIYAMDHPTVNEFATYIQVSSPNAAYKVGKLIQKGYVRKVQSLNDKREYHLEATEKYMNYYNLSFDYLKTVVSRLEEELSEPEKKQLSHILDLMSHKLMPEVPEFNKKAEK